MMAGRTTSIYGADPTADGAYSPSTAGYPFAHQNCSLRSGYKVMHQGGCTVAATAPGTIRRSGHDPSRELGVLPQLRSHTAKVRPPDPTHNASSSAHHQPRSCVVRTVRLTPHGTGGTLPRQGRPDRMPGGPSPRSVPLVGGDAWASHDNPTTPLFLRRSAWCAVLTWLRCWCHAG
jgi:hypothetical protein